MEKCDEYFETSIYFQSKADQIIQKVEEENCVYT